MRAVAWNLETLSSIFTRGRYKENGERPVVLLGHSMGCKMGHYFPNWVVNDGPGCADCPTICAHDPQRDGHAWLRKHVFSLFAVGQISIDFVP